MRTRLNTSIAAFWWHLVATSPRRHFQWFGGSISGGRLSTAHCIQAEHLTSSLTLFTCHSFQVLVLISVCLLSSLWGIMKTAQLFLFQWVTHTGTCRLHRNPSSSYPSPTLLPFTLPERAHAQKTLTVPKPFPLINLKKKKGFKPTQTGFFPPETLGYTTS